MKSNFQGRDMSLSFKAFTLATWQKMELRAEIVLRTFCGKATPDDKLPQL